MVKGKIALGAIVGAAAGIIAGVMTAPKSGKETRADIKDKADELKSNAQAKKEEAMKKAENVKNDVKKRFDK